VALVALEIPKVGLVMENARLVRWLKSVGDVVQQGEPLLELETEKSVVEIESAESGRLVDILLQVDQEVHVGDRIAWVENDARGAVVGHGVAGAHGATGAHDAAGAHGVVGAQGAAATHGTAAAHGMVRTASAPSSVSQVATNSTPAASPAFGRIRSSPVARRLAAEQAVDLGRIVGTGPRGRVQLTDVQRAIDARSATPPPPGFQPLSSMRRAVTRSMTLSNATVPQFSVERAVDWTALHTVRAKLFEELPAGELRPSANDFLLLGIARALIRFPALNATFRGTPGSFDEGIVPANGAHIGLVVAVENGVLVPVIHGVEQFGLVELARRRRDTIERALKGRLKQEELEGATFSLSNLGAHGPDRFNAIINPPQSAILAVGRQRNCVVALDGDIQMRPISQLTLTVDHRVADGRLASDFLASLVDILEGDVWP
jgi:pyruvate dehydrogenase E2 component (dihydrolipoamide acetyltransferase)